MKTEQASVTVEAAMILPLVTMFVLLLTSFIRIAAVDLALSAAVSETGKEIAAHWGPVRMVAEETRRKVEETKAGSWAKSAMERVQSARSSWVGAEEWLQNYEELLPDSIRRLVVWELDRRHQLETRAQEYTSETVGGVVDPLVRTAVEPILHHYANQKLLKPERLKLEAVKLPGLFPGGEAYVELTASYEVKLPVPFINKTILLEKKTVERAWVGDQ